MMRSLVSLSLLLSSITLLTVSCGSDELTGANDESEGGDDGGGAGGKSGGGGKAGGSTTTAGRGGAPPTASNFGRACSETADCGADLECLTARDLPGGLCTAGCSSNADCEALGDSAACLPEGDGVCFEGCQNALGAKCHGREDLVCAVYDVTEGRTCTSDSECTGGAVCLGGTCLAASTACLPSCASDADCSEGLSCDLELGSCREMPKTGLPIGSPCSPAAEEDPCSGFCLRYGEGDDEGLCSGLCRIGFASGIPGCGYGADATDVEAACLFISAFLPGEDGDSGFCAQLCDCDAECLTPGFKCVDYEKLLGGPVFGRRGQCSPVSEDDPTIPVCVGGGGASGAGGEGGAAGASGAGGTGAVSEGGAAGAAEAGSSGSSQGGSPAESGAGGSTG